MMRPGLTPLEEAIERAMRRHDPLAVDVAERDATAVARIVLRHWGDDAPRVLTRAVRLAADEVKRWGAPDAKNPPPGSMDPKSSDAP